MKVKTSAGMSNVLFNTKDECINEATFELDKLNTRHVITTTQIETTGTSEKNM